MQSRPKAKIGSCCYGCTSRSADPPCHSYCPTYLAAKMEHDATAAEDKRRSSLAVGLIDQECRGLRRRAKQRRKR